MKAGEFAKWTSEDEQGKFSHVGKILRMDQVWISLQTAQCVLSFRATDGVLTPHAPIDLTPINVEEVIPVEASEKKADKPAKSSQVKQGSKLEAAIAIVKANPGASRKELIAKFVEQLSMTPAGASTYVHNARKAIGTEE